MKNLFVILVKYEADLARIDEALARHRAFLQTGYDSGILLASGPQNPRTGGIIIGQFSDKSAAEDFTRGDPYYKENLASYTILEFSPVLHSGILGEFVR